MQTDDFEVSGCGQAKEPEFGKVAVGPALMVAASPAPSKFSALAQDSSQSRSYPSVHLREALPLGMFEVAVEALQLWSQLTSDSLKAPPARSLRQRLDRRPELLLTFGSDETADVSTGFASPEHVSEELETGFGLPHIHDSGFPGV